MAQRLPETSVPENYKLTFTPDFNKNNFAGEEVIKIRVLKPTSQIVLNSADIEISEAVRDHRQRHPDSRPSPLTRKRRW